MLKTMNLIFKWTLILTSSLHCLVGNALKFRSKKNTNAKPICEGSKSKIKESRKLLAIISLIGQERRVARKKVSERRTSRSISAKFHVCLLSIRSLTFELTALGPIFRTLGHSVLLWAIPSCNVICSALWPFGTIKNMAKLWATKCKGLYVSCLAY